MQTPYLVLSRQVRTAFRELQRANPGLRIRVSTNSSASTDNLLAYSANFRLRNVWPIQNTSSFELRPGGVSVPPERPSFYEQYREVGSFPGTEGFFSEKEILTRLYKAVGAPLTPIR